MSEFQGGRGEVEIKSVVGDNLTNITSGDNLTNIASGDNLAVENSFVNPIGSGRLQNQRTL